jgi:hypothetical protein
MPTTGDKHGFLEGALDEQRRPQIRHQDAEDER